MRDLWAEGGLPGAFWFHHAMVFAGILLCLNMPSYVGMITINGLSAEIGSGGYNLTLLRPDSGAAWALYVDSMHNND